MAPSSAPQNPAQDTTMSAGMTPSGGPDAGDPAAGLLDAGHPGRALEAGAARLGAAGQRDDRPGRLGQAVGGDVQAAEDAVAVDQRVQPHALVRVDHLRLDAPGGGPALPAVQVGEPLGRGGDLQAADLVEAPGAVDVDARELLDGVAGERRHRLRGVGLEDQPGRVRGGAAGQRKRSLVDHGDAVPAAGGQLVGQVGADDPRSDDDHTRGGGHCSAPDYRWIRGLPTTVGQLSWVVLNSRAASSSQSAR